MPLVVVAIAAAIWPTIVGAMQSEQNEMRSEKKGNRRKASCAVCYDGKNQPTHTHKQALLKRMYRHTKATTIHRLRSTAGSRFSLEHRRLSSRITRQQMMLPVHDCNVH